MRNFQGFIAHLA